MAVYKFEFCSFGYALEKEISKIGFTMFVSELQLDVEAICKEKVE